MDEAPNIGKSGIHIHPSPFHVYNTSGTQVRIHWLNNLQNVADFQYLLVSQPWNVKGSKYM